MTHAEQITALQKRIRKVPRIARHGQWDIAYRRAKSAELIVDKNADACAQLIAEARHALQFAEAVIA